VKRDKINLVNAVKDRAQAEGFSACGIAPAALAPETAARLQTWLADGRHGDMIWMESRADERADPQTLWPEVRSVIMLGMSYAPGHDPMALAEHPDHARISAYAKGRDYHDVVKGALKRLAGWLAHQSGADVKVFVDTAPVMERALAQAAGIGWQGKHTNIVSRTHGSWLFLGAIYTTAELEQTTPVGDRCGSCQACQDICPTAAFPAPYQLDARRCISYLTIEHKGPIPHELRAGIGNHIYGCDDCLAVCPWNKFADAAATQKAFHPRAELTAPEISDLLTLDDAAFRALFSSSPVKRTGRNRFIRNVLIAAGNSGNAGHLDRITALLNDPEPVVRGAAIWALGQIDAARFAAERETRQSSETDADVLTEWQVRIEH
jgi:epoxyqueuosine reductase